MVTRYEVRNNCFRMQRGAAPSNPELIAEIDKLRGNFSWRDFSQEWDVNVTNGKIYVYKSIKDINAVSEVCAKCNMAADMDIQKDWTDEEQAVINMIESQFLEGKMDWKNYKTAWRIKWDNEQNRIVTEIIRSAPLQKEVTQAMIDEKIREQLEQNKKIEKAILQARPMTEQEKEFYLNLIKQENS